jgi:hypothetical protein
MALKPTLPEPGPAGTREHADFLDLVALDAKLKHGDRISSEEREYLRSEEILPHWHAALRELIADAHAQFADKKAEANAFQQRCHERGYSGKQDWFTFKANHDRWRADASRYLSALNNRVGEAKILVDQYKARKRGRDGRQRDLLARQRDLLREALPYLKDTPLEGEVRGFVDESNGNGSGEKA